MTQASVASISVFGDRNPMGFAVCHTYFLTFSIQKYTVLIYFSQLILVENKRAIKMYSYRL